MKFHLKVFVICLTVFASRLSYGEQWGKNENPGQLFKSCEFDLDKLPLEGQISKSIWHTKNWRTCKGGLAKRRNGDIASLKDIQTCSRENLSPVEKIDLCKGVKPFSYTYEALWKYNIDCEKWEGICHNIRVLQLSCNEPKPCDYKGFHFDIDELVALQCLYLDRIPYSASILGARYDQVSKNLNAGSFHIILSTLVGLQEKGFIYIPHILNQDNKPIIFNELVLSYESKILFRNDEKAHIQSKIKVLSEDDEGLDIIKEHNLDYILELENGKIVGGSWVNHSIAPLMVWNLDDQCNAIDILKNKNFLEYL